MFRSAPESQVTVDAYRINQGKMPVPDTKKGSDVFFVDAADPEEGVRKLMAVVFQRIPSRFGLGPVRNVLLVCPKPRRSRRSVTGHRPAGAGEPAR